ncbi:flagellar basal-body MS-ring and collar protein [Georgfuchsia toluolica]|uniref:Flagellar M-ring protein n=1 Tax=Georgfuchsia toluolica TaxID=424218 RepID=A0A916N136_9PROT|nr:flagellar basal-body MS-ring/collar protein FliF [Georgfuchsia toluolica]CAG4882200.1 flagellar basal-body MS-ring and collar protein [Georgfuchsia toluolica]
MTTEKKSLVARLPNLMGPANMPSFGLLIGLAAFVALMFGAWTWSQAPEYRVLFSNISDRDGGAIVAALQQANVPYKFAEGGGAILVPTPFVYEARLRLASQGLPKGSLVGFELMENPKFGTSQFLEQVNYQRALEGELARSIQSLSAVAGARVHLALVKPSVFYREQQKPTASVIVNLHPGRNLEPDQVSAIAHLVSSSIPDLSVKNVSIIDQNGNLLSTEHNAGNHGLDPGQIKYVQDLEQSYAKRIESILAPLVGGANVRAQITADIDFSQIEKAEETYKPNQNPAEAVIRSQQTSESNSGTGAQPGGVPGALSNQPPASASAPLTAAGGAAAAVGNTSGNSRKDLTINYEIDKTIRHVQQPFGGIKRLSAAVVVNYRKVTSTAGKASYRALSAQDLGQITDLVKEAMGYNKERGDTLNVVNSLFTIPEQEVVSETPFWKQPSTIQQAKDIGKQLLIAGVAIFLVLSVLRPLLKELAQARVKALPPVITPDGQTITQMISSPDQNLEMVKQLARQEPKLVANVVKNWVAAGE